MPPQKPRDTRKRFLTLYRFIETNLTEENWRELTHKAARFFVPYKAPKKPPGKKALILRKHGAARYRAVELDVYDLEGARAIQARFRQELSAIRRGEGWPAHISASRLLESRFDRLKLRLTNSPMYVKEHLHSGNVRAIEMRGFVYEEWVERKCIGTGCSRAFLVAPSSHKRTCCRACAIDADNTRRKELREASRTRLRLTKPARFTQS